MKKLVPILCILLTLCGCSARNITPTINTSFDTKAVYKVGDFYFDCDISCNKKIVTVIPTNTLASGLVISYDGSNVTFKRNDMSKSIKANNASPYNPAVIIYDVVSVASALHSDKNDNGYSYDGTIPIGRFRLVTDKNGDFITITIPDADIEISFNPK